jgi:hypothetical protein
VKGNGAYAYMSSPSIYTEDLGVSICDKVASGEWTLRQIAESEGISAAVILKWAANLSEFRERYARAVDIGADARFEALADDLSVEPPKDTFGRVDSGWVNWKRLQTDTKKWALSKQVPKKYGERAHHEHTGPDSGPMQFVVKSILDEGAK